MRVGPDPGGCFVVPVVLKELRDLDGLAGIERMFRYPTPRPKEMTWPPRALTALMCSPFKSPRTSAWTLERRALRTCGAPAWTYPIRAYPG